MATACLMPGDDPANAATATAARTRKGKTRNTVKRADIHTSPQPMGDSVALIRTNSWDRVSIPQLRYSGTGGAAGAERLTFHPMAEGGPLGMRLRRLEDGRLLRGTAKFADDLEPDGCLHVGLLRSPRTLHSCMKPWRRTSTFWATAPTATWRTRSSALI